MLQGSSSPICYAGNALCTRQLRYLTLTFNLIGLDWRCACVSMQDGYLWHVVSKFNNVFF